MKLEKQKEIDELEKEKELEAASAKKASELATLKKIGDYNQKMKDQGKLNTSNSLNTSTLSERERKYEKYPEETKILKQQKI